MGGKERVFRQELAERQVRAVAVHAVGQHEPCRRQRRREPYDLADGDTSPAVVEAAPAGNTVEVGRKRDPRESEELLPVESRLALPKAVDAEAPSREARLR